MLIIPQKKWITMSVSGIKYVPVKVKASDLQRISKQNTLLLKTMVHLIGGYAEGCFKFLLKHLQM